MGEPQKEYYLRNIPPSLHRDWKMLAHALGKDMRLIILEALRIHIEKLHKEVIETRKKSADLFKAIGIVDNIMDSNRTASGSASDHPNVLVEEIINGVD